MFPGSEICIFVQVLQADGGVRSACINAVTLALIDAGIPMKDFIVSCRAGLLDGEPAVDLNGYEDASPGPDLSIAYLPKSEKLVSISMDNKVCKISFLELLYISVVFIF